MNHRVRKHDCIKDQHDHKISCDFMSARHQLNDILGEVKRTKNIINL